VRVEVQNAENEGGKAKSKCTCGDAGQHIQVQERRPTRTRVENEITIYEVGWERGTKAEWW
jgi:hypothetical protein